MILTVVYTANSKKVVLQNLNHMILTAVLMNIRYREFVYNDNSFRVCLETRNRIHGNNIFIAGYLRERGIHI